MSILESRLTVTEPARLPTDGRELDQVEEVTESVTCVENAAGPEGHDGPSAALAPKRPNWRKSGAAVIEYLLDSQVHTYAFSVAANAIISFIPFIVLLYTISRGVFHSEAMVEVVGKMVHVFLPSNQDWVAASLEAASARHGVQLLSLVMIIISCTGIFLPLEVALNQACGVTRHRNYLMNQLVAFGLALVMVVLALLSILLSAGQRTVLAILFFHHTQNIIFEGISSVWLLLLSGVASILFFFSIYWLLPNRRIPPRHVIKTSLITGVIWLGAKYVYVAVLPMLNLKALYGPFYVSVGLLFWAYCSGLILLAGAQMTSMPPAKKDSH